MERPKSHFGTGKNADKVKQSAPVFPATMPDIDKLMRAILDGLTDAQVWLDDGQVVWCPDHQGLRRDDRFNRGVYLTVGEMPERTRKIKSTLVRTVEVRIDGGSPSPSTRCRSRSNTRAGWVASR